MPALGHVFSGYQVPQQPTYVFSPGGQSAEPAAPNPGPSGGMSVGGRDFFGPGGDTPSQSGHPSIGYRGLPGQRYWGPVAAATVPFAGPVLLGTGVWRGSHWVPATPPTQGMQQIGFQDVGDQGPGRAPDFSYSDREKNTDKGLPDGPPDRRDKDDDTDEE